MRRFAYLSSAGSTMRTKLLRAPLLSLLSLSLLSPVALLPLAGCSGQKAESSETRAKAKPVAAQTVAVVEKELPSTLLLAGTLKANQESELAANASGRVMRTMIERGSYVGRGQAIVQLDVRMATLSASEADANLQTARTQKSAAEDECARVKRLLERGAISQQEFDRQITSCKTTTSSAVAAETRVAVAKQTLSDGTVRAPFPGLVSERYVSVGEYVQPSTKIAHVVDIDPLRLELTIPEQNMSAVKEGQNVAFQVGAFPGRTFTGTVHYIGPAVRATTRDLVFEAMVSNTDKLLRPGLFATAHLDVGLQKLPVVPASALKTEGDTTRVYAVIEKHVEERIVQVGPKQGDVVAIVNGVNVGERVIAQADRADLGRRGSGVAHAMARSTLRPAAGLRLRADAGHRRRRRRRLLQARRRPVPQGRLPRRRRDHAPRRRGAGGGRDRDHRQDRGGGQHHQRHRRAALDVDRGRLAGRHHLHASTRTSTSPRRTCATTCQRRSADLPQGHRPAGRRQDRSRRRRRSCYIAVQSTRGRSARSPSSPTSACAGRSRASPASVRSTSSAGASGRSTSGSTRSQLRAVGLTAADVQRAIATQNLTTPGGAVETGPTELTLRVAGARRPARRRWGASSCARRAITPIRVERRGARRGRRGRGGDDVARSTASRRSCSRSASSRARTRSPSSTPCASALSRRREDAARRLQARRSCATTRASIRTGVDAVKEHLVARRVSRRARRAPLPRQPALARSSPRSRSRSRSSAPSR